MSEISDQNIECKTILKVHGAIPVHNIKIKFLTYKHSTKLILLFWHRSCPYNLFWCITSSPEATPNWCLFSAPPCWHSNPSLLPSLKIILILPLLLFSLLCLFFQESSLQRFKEPLIKRFSLFLNYWCILKLYGWVLNFSARVMCVRERGV